MLTTLRAFIAGFLSTLVFHQGLLWLLRLAGQPAPAPWNFSPVAPFGVPSVVSLAFWGGLWGIAIWFIIRRHSGFTHWMAALALGALLPSLVAWFIVMPLKGMAVAGGFSPTVILGALLVNGAWGIGLAVFMRVVGERR